MSATRRDGGILDRLLGRDRAKPQPEEQATERRDEAAETPEPEAAETPEPEAAEPSEPPAETVEPVPPAVFQVVAGEAEAEAVEVEAPAESRAGWFRRLKDGLAKSSRSLTGGITDIFTKRKLDDETLQELEDILIQADLGVDTAMRITEQVAAGRYNKEVSPDEVKDILAREVAAVLEPLAKPLAIDETKKPFVILTVGVNGSGKTTTIGKIAAQLAREGRSVMLAAGDTFRAAAVEQLKIWGDRTGVPVMSRETGADASGLAFDAFRQAREEGRDALIIDTAGRLQNKASLMAELEKIVRVLKKQDETAPHSVLLVLDATTGQNAMSQVEIFQKTAGVTGLVMTKLDGTARGGILVAIAERFGLPIHAVGVGEGIEDLQPFEAEAFARAIAGLE